MNGPEMNETPVRGNSTCVPFASVTFDWPAKVPLGLRVMAAQNGLSMPDGLS